MLLVFVLLECVTRETKKKGFEISCEDGFYFCHSCVLFFVGFCVFYLNLPSIAHVINSITKLEKNAIKNIKKIKTHAWMCCE